MQTNHLAVFIIEYFLRGGINRLNKSVWLDGYNAFGDIVQHRAGSLFALLQRARALCHAVFQRFIQFGQ